MLCGDPAWLRVLGMRVRSGLTDAARGLRIDLLRARRVATATHGHAIGVVSRFIDTTIASAAARSLVRCCACVIVPTGFPY